MQLSFEAALRLSEILVGWAVLQASAEHLVTHPRWRWFYGARAGAAVVLMLGLWPVVAVWAVWLGVVLHLRIHHGPYNGGADKMAVLILTCLGGAHIAPDRYWAEMALAYLAVQLVLSYFVSGWIKVINPEWRRGRALSDVFRFSAYPVHEDLRVWSKRLTVLFVMGWAVMLLELLFPLAMLSQPVLIAALCLTAAFHVSNAYFFGLNRFVWIWVAAYPVLIWFQGRVVPANVI